MLVYSSKPREIFIDDDRERFSLKDARHILRISRITWAHIHQFWSKKLHRHYVVLLSEPLSIIERVTLAVLMGSDRNRALLTLDRVRQQFPNPDLLFPVKPFPWRSEDMWCKCTAPSDKVIGCKHLHEFQHFKTLKISSNNMKEMEKQYKFSPSEKI